MRVIIYEDDGDYMGTECELHEAIPGDDQDAVELRERATVALQDKGRFWIGGGAAPLFLLTSVVEFNP